MLGQPLEPVRPHLAEAQRTERSAPEQVSIIERALAKVDRPGFDPADLDAGERLLTGHAAEFGPKDLRGWPSRWWTRSTPTAPCPGRTATVTAGSSTSGRPTTAATPGSSGSPGACGVKLQALLGPLAKPRVTTAVGLGRAAGRDSRIRGTTGSGCTTRWKTCATGCSAPRQPGPRRRRHPGHRDHHHRHRRPARQHRLRHRHRRHPDPHRHRARLADQADIYTAFLNAAGEVLRLGRSRRIATRSQTIALIARDGGCSFPGCDTASRNGPNATTSCPGSTAAPPTWTT